MSTRFEYHSPRTVPETLELLARYDGKALVLAGGTDIVPKLEKGTLHLDAVISLRHLSELRGIDFDATSGLTIGATARIAEVLDHSAVRRHYPDLVEALSQLATVQVRNMGTIAGNLCNASPCADSAPPLLAHDARLTLVGPDGTRSLPLTEFLLGPGRTARTSGEIVSSIHVPLPPASAGFAFRSISARSKVDMSAVSVGAMVRVEGERIDDARLFLGAVGPTTLRASSAESVLRGQTMTDALATAAGEAAATDAKPISDVRASAWWRRRMVGVLTRRAVLAALERAAS